MRLSSPTLRNIGHNEFYSAVISMKYHPKDCIAFMEVRPDLQSTLVRAFEHLWNNSKMRGMTPARMNELRQIYQEKGIVRIRMSDYGNDILVLNNFYRTIIQYLIRS